jgi:hypothetical protein
MSFDWLAGGRNQDRFLSPRDEVIGKTPFYREEAFLELQWWPRRPTIAVLGIPSSFKAIILIFSAT